MLSLTAGTAIIKGRLSDLDCRWDAICQSVDDRTREERDPNSEHYIPKSRFDTISFYISEDKRNLNEYNNYKFPLNTEMMNYARDMCKKYELDIDDKYIEHLGYLFMRDAL